MGEVEAENKASSLIDKLIKQIQDFSLSEQPQAVTICRRDINVMV